MWCSPQGAKLSEDSDRSMHGLQRHLAGRRRIGTGRRQGKHQLAREILAKERLAYQKPGDRMATSGKFIRRVVALVLFVTFTHQVKLALAQEGKIVPYVPTPQEVVDRMLELAEVKKGDVVYDLGSGDGRIVVTAAKKYGVKAIGFEIDPQRIKESHENIKKAGVTTIR